MRDGTEVRVNFGIDESVSGEKILVVDFRNDRRMVRETAVQQEVFDIWTGLADEAERAGTREGFIRYRYSTGVRNEEEKIIFELLLFAAEKTENGAWTITRVN